VCNEHYFKSAVLSSGAPDCEPCLVGTTCHAPSATRQSLTLQIGYWRLSADSLDVRRCPDAADGCSSTGRGVCDTSTSSCRGGSNGSAYCAPSLTGPFCRLCAASPERVHYTAASSSHVAAAPGAPWLSRTHSHRHRPLHRPWAREQERRSMQPEAPTVPAAPSASARAPHTWSAPRTGGRFRYRRARQGPAARTAVQACGSFPPEAESHELRRFARARYRRQLRLCASKAFW
jgi:hypothetical protein